MNKGPGWQRNVLLTLDLWVQLQRFSHLPANRNKVASESGGRLGSWVTLVAIAGVVIGLLLSVGPSKTITSTERGRLSTLEQTCSQWKITRSSQATSPSDWCPNMVGWMSNHMEDRPGMWTSPSAMETTCQEWSSSNPGGVSEGDRIAWCDDMVSWMQQHAMGSWKGWMMYGP
jgi:hypothetical protein